MSAPERTAVRATLRLTPEAEITLRVTALRDNVSPSQIATRAVERYLAGRIRDPRIARAVRAVAGHDATLSAIAPTSRRSIRSTHTDPSIPEADHHVG